MREYVVKLPGSSGYGVMRGRAAKFAVIVRNDLSQAWRIHSLYKTRAEAEKVIPTYVSRYVENAYDDSGLRIDPDFVAPTEPWRYTSVVPVMGYIVPNKGE